MVEAETKPVLGWLGTGVMGNPMCLHLLSKGYKLLVFNRTKAKTDNLVEKGAIYASPKEIAEQVDILLMCMTYPQDVQSQILDKETGVLKYMKKGSILVDHGTNGPKFAF